MEEVIKLEGIRIRLAKLPDLEKITLLEREVWGENAATPEQIESRIKTFSEGNYVAEDLFSGNIMGYVCFQYTSDLRVSDNLNWFDITDKGFIARSHKPGGDYLYGVNLSVHHSMNGKDLGKILVFQCFLHMVIKRKRGVFLGSRIPMFGSYKDRFPDVTVQQYVKLRYNGGRLYDYELYLYDEVLLKMEIIKVMPNFFPDPKSLNYGVLLFDENVFCTMSDQEIKKIAEMIVNQKFYMLKGIREGL